MRHNIIIEHTASRIASNNQLEVFLKVKQANNADFTFLNPSDELYAYYRYVKEKHNNNGKNENASKGSEGCDIYCNPLSGLLGGYASSSDESTGDNNSIANEAEGKPTTTSLSKDNTQPSTQSDEQDRKRRADRLERLRKWKEARLKQENNK